MFTKVCLHILPHFVFITPVVKPVISLVMRSFQEIEHALTDKDGFSKRPNRPRPFKANLLGGDYIFKERSSL